MSARSKLGSLRATLADERSRLGSVLDQIDEALDCLEPGAQREDVDRERTTVSSATFRESHRSAPAQTIREAADAGHRAGRPGAEGNVPLAAWGPISADKAQARGSLDRVLEGKASTAESAQPRPLGESLGQSARPLRPMRRAVSDLSAAADAAWRQRREAKNKQSQVGRQIFANADQMKEQVQKAILEPEYNVRDMYSDRGVWQLVARHQIFDVLSLTVICLNALWLAVETDYNDEALLVNADTPFIVVENFFCAFFVGELLIRFMAFRVKADIFKDNWFLFDSGLVFFMAFETWILSFIVWASGGSFGASSSSTSVLRVVRLFRMTRAARVARLLKAVPELMVIGRGIVIVARTVVVIMCLLVMIIYTFAIVFTQLAKGTDLEKNVHPNAKCSDMVTTMSTLLLGGILPDFAPTTEDFAAEDFFFAAFFFMFILLAYVTIMNMLIGVLVEVVAVVASVEKETNQVAAVKRVLLKWTPDTDLDGDCRIGVDEFKNMLNNDGCAKDLNDVGVDAVALIDHADFVFRNKDALTFSELLTVVLGLRGRNDTKVQDLVQMRKFLHVEMQRIEASLESLHVSLVGESSRPDDVKTGKSFGNLQHEASVVTRDTTTYRSDVIVRNSELSEAILDADQTIELMESEAPVQRPVDDDEVTPIDPKADW